MVTDCIRCVAFCWGRDVKVGRLGRRTTKRSYPSLSFWGCCVVSGRGNRIVSRCREKRAPPPSRQPNGRACKGVGRPGHGAVFISTVWDTERNAQRPPKTKSKAQHDPRQYRLCLLSFAFLFFFVSSTAIQLRSRLCWTGATQNTVYITFKPLLRSLRRSLLLFLLPVPRNLQLPRRRHQRN